MRLSGERASSEGLRPRLRGRRFSRSQRSAGRWYLVNLGLVTLIIWLYASMHVAAYCEPCPNRYALEVGAVVGALSWGAIYTLGFMMLYGLPALFYLLGLRRLARNRSGVRGRAIALGWVIPWTLLLLFDVLVYGQGIRPWFATWPLAFAAVVRLPRQP